MYHIIIREKGKEWIINELEDSSFEIIKEVIIDELANDIASFICSKNPSYEKAVGAGFSWDDKVKWVTEYLDDVFHKKMVITHRKDLCQGDYLIDERGKNGTSEFRGKWIEFGSPRFPDWDSVVEYLSSRIKKPDEQENDN